MPGIDASLVFPIVQERENRFWASRNRDDTAILGKADEIVIVCASRMFWNVSTSIHQSDRRVPAMEGRRDACAECAARGVSRYPFTVRRVGAPRSPSRSAA